MTGIFGGQCTVQHWYQQFPAGTNVRAGNGDNPKIWSGSKLLLILFYLNVDYNVIHSVHMK